MTISKGDKVIRKFDVTYVVHELADNEFHYNVERTIEATDFNEAYQLANELAFELEVEFSEVTESFVTFNQIVERSNEND